MSLKTGFLFSRIALSASRGHHRIRIKEKLKVTRDEIIGGIVKKLIAQGSEKTDKIVLLLEDIKKELSKETDNDSKLTIKKKYK